LLDALDCFRGALEIDPNYAESWTGIADVYSLLGSYVYGVHPPAHAMREARSAAKKALVLHPNLPSAHAALAGIQFNYDWDLDGAERSYEQALSLDPANAVARQWYAFLLASRGRWDDAQAQLRRARELDPISPLGFTIRAHLRYYRRDFEGALTVVDEALARDSGFRSAILLRALILVQLGKIDDALIGLKGAGAGREEAEPLALGLLGLVLGKSGDLAGAGELMDQLRQLRESDFIPAECLVLAALGVGDLECAIDWLEEARNERSSSILYLEMEPLTDPLRDHPRFREIVSSIQRRRSLSFLP